MFWLITTNSVSGKGDGELLAKSSFHVASKICHCWRPSAANHSRQFNCSEGESSSNRTVEPALFMAKNAPRNITVTHNFSKVGNQDAIPVWGSCEAEAWRSRADKHCARLQKISSEPEGQHRNNALSGTDEWSITAKSVIHITPQTLWVCTYLLLRIFILAQSGNAVSVNTTRLIAAKKRSRILALDIGEFLWVALRVSLSLSNRTKLDAFSMLKRVHLIRQALNHLWWSSSRASMNYFLTSKKLILFCCSLNSSQPFLSTNSIETCLCR